MSDDILKPPSAADEDLQELIEARKHKRQQFFVPMPKPSITLPAWECPACGVGVRGDVEVCPNCVNRANKVEFITIGNVITETGETAAKGLADELVERLRKTGAGRP